MQGVCLVAALGTQSVFSSLQELFLASTRKHQRTKILDNNRWVVRVFSERENQLHSLHSQTYKIQFTNHNSKQTNVAYKQRRENAINQSQLKANKCSRRQERENPINQSQI